MTTAQVSEREVLAHLTCSVHQDELHLSDFLPDSVADVLESDPRKPMSDKTLAERFLTQATTEEQRRELMAKQYVARKKEESNSKEWTCGCRRKNKKRANPDALVAHIAHAQQHQDELQALLGAVLGASKTADEMVKQCISAEEMLSKNEKSCFTPQCAICAEQVRRPFMVDHVVTHWRHGDVYPCEDREGKDHACTANQDCGSNKRLVPESSEDREGKDHAHTSNQVRGSKRPRDAPAGCWPPYGCD